MVLKSTLLLIVAFVFLLACSQSNKEDRTQETDSNSTDISIDKLQLVKIDGYQFRRAYHGHEFLEGEALTTFMNRNPESSWNYEDSLHKPYYSLLIQKGIILDGNLNISNLDTLPDSFDYQISKGRTVQVRTEYTDSPSRVSQPAYILSFYEKEKKFRADTFYYENPADVTFYLYDLNQDGKDEILSIYRWYIINGDNFDVDIHELR